MELHIQNPFVDKQNHIKMYSGQSGHKKERKQEKLGRLLKNQLQLVRIAKNQSQSSYSSHGSRNGGADLNKATADSRRQRSVRDPNLEQDQAAQPIINIKTSPLHK